MQKSERIEDRMRRLPESFEQRGQGGFGRARTLGVSAHAVDHDQKRRLLGLGHRYAILILFAMANQAHIGGFDLQ